MNTNDSQPSRRDFLKTSTAAAVGGALASDLAFPRIAKAAPNSDKLRIGFIGCGGRGTGAVGQALQADSNVVLHAMGDVFESQLAKSLDAAKNAVKEADKFDVPKERQFIGLDAFEKVL